MGILASTMRLMVLTNSKNEIDFRMMDNAQKIAGVTSQIAEKEEFCTGLDPNDATVRKMETEKKRLNVYEKQLQQQQKMLEIQSQEIAQELQACQQALQQSIQSSGFFTYGLGGGR